MKVLNVEDDRLTSETLAKLLTKVSDGRVQVFSASTLFEGIRLSQEVKPDVTFLDLMLPDAPDWHITVDRIQDFKPPVIVVTAQDISANDFEIKFACMQAGAQRVFEKPFMKKAWNWLWSSSNELFVSRLMGAAEAAHLRNTIGPKNGEAKI